MTTSIKKLMLAAFAEFAICLSARAATVDISTLSGEYIAKDGDVFVGTQNGQVPIRLKVPGMTVTLAGIYLADSILAYTNDVTIIIADGTTNTIRPYYGYPGIRLSADVSHTLTIKGESGNTGVLDVKGGKDDSGNGRRSAAIGSSKGETSGGVVIVSGTIIALGNDGCPGIGASKEGYCAGVTIRGGNVTSTGGSSACGIGASTSGTCGSVTIEPTVEMVVATGATMPIKADSITISPSLKPTYSNDDRTLTIVPVYKYDVAWLNDDGTEIDTTIVPSNVVPVHAEPTKAAAVPYRWVFTGWTPELEAAVSNATYTATFKIVADLSLCTNDWTAADGDEIVGETAHEVSIPGGAHVTINGVAVAGTGGGGSVPAPAFAAGGASEIVKFAQAEGGKWTITAFAEMSNESRGTDVTDGQIKVYAAGAVEDLDGASPMTSGVEVKGKKSAVMTTIEVTPPTAAPAQFFRVKFGE